MSGLLWERRSVLCAVLIALLTASFAARTRARTISDIPTAQESLLRTVSPKFYKSLLISPVAGWVVARGWLTATRLQGSRIIHSELNGNYDSLTLELANNLEVVDFASANSSERGRAVLVHLLVYNIADGTLTLSFANFEEPGGSQLRYYGAAWMAVERANHLWVTIEPNGTANLQRRAPRSYTLGAYKGAKHAGLPLRHGVSILRSR